jgi:hypothetical protein
MENAVSRFPLSSYTPAPTSVGFRSKPESKPYNFGDRVKSTAPNDWDEVASCKSEDLTVCGWGSSFDEMLTFPN